MGTVYTSQQGIILESPYDDPRFNPVLDQKRKSVTRNMICVPLTKGNKCIGCIEVANKTTGEFTEQDYKFVITITKELYTGLITKEDIGEFKRNDSEFKEKIGEMANENLLTPLLKNVLILLASMIKSEK